MEPHICIQFLNIPQVNIHHFDFELWFNKAYRTVARTIPGGLTRVQKMNMCNYLHDELNNNIDVNTQEDFDDWQKNVIDEISQIGDFELGKSQKIVNMLLKYFCCWYYSDQDPNFNVEYNHLVLCFQYFHAPVDNIVLKSVLRLDEYNLDIIRRIGHDNPKFLVNNVHVPWSKLDNYEIYMELQNFIQERADALGLFSKLDFEMQHLWIP